VDGDPEAVVGRSIRNLLRTQDRQMQTGKVAADDIPKVTIRIWRADAIVLFDWLMHTDLNTVPIEHPAEKQALADLLSRLEDTTDVPYGDSGKGLTQQEIDTARAAVAKDMGW
jgi:hypothetical protein